MAKGNLFMVGGQGSGTLILSPAVHRPMSNEEVLNLVAWLLAVSGQEPKDIQAAYDVAIST